jgi:hypothetical protein
LIAPPRSGRTARARALGLLALACLSGCASEAPEHELPIGEWTELLAGDWKLEPGEEKYICAKKTLSHPIHVGGFRSIGPAGTHHTVLSITDVPGEDGVAPCSWAVDGHQIVFASGLGTGELSLPEGVAATVPAGTRLLLNMHLVNVTAEPIAGRSGTSVLLVEPDRVEQVAEVILAGKVDGLEVVPGDSVQTGLCTFSGPSALFAVLPHMHERGRHMKVVRQSASGEDVVYDQDFDVDAQSYALMDPLREMAAGDQLRIECSYSNASPDTLHFGPNATDEMCYAISVRYPALGTSPLCDE